MNSNLIKQDRNENGNAQLITNNENSNVVDYLRGELANCTNFEFSVAFITPAGLNLIQMKLKELDTQGYGGKILTSTYMDFNKPDTFRNLFKIKNLEVRISNHDFHSKGYIFKHQDRYTSLIGSSNLTEKALMKNIEWNLSLEMGKEEKIYQNIKKEFDEEWEDAVGLSQEWISTYEKSYQKLKKKKRANEGKDKDAFVYKKIQMNDMQKKAIDNLVKMRNDGKEKALIISATGTGKTYLAAFDVNKVKPKRLLFLAHQERLIKNARESFMKVLGNQKSTGLFYAKEHNMDCDYLFASVYTLHKDKYLKKFNKDHFDYIIVDEVHHVGADIYNKLLSYFQPKFLLGMTATPERTDEYNVFEYFNYNVAYEIRLQDALAENMLCPFHYFGISDITIDGKIIEDETNFEQLADDQRIDHIIENADYYGYSGDKVRGLIFCRSVIEAEMLSDKLNSRGLRTIALSGSKTSDADRENAIKRLEKKESTNSLDYIITVDIFNEGIDIPSVNQIIMLRSTESSIVFIQQLGRGLRKDLSKDYVTVLDFIGNYDKNFFIPIALSGDSSFDKDKLRKFMHDSNLKVPGESSIEFDYIVKERIYAAINSARFDSINFIKEQYFSLKRKLGRMPRHIDFLKNESIDLQLIIKNKQCKNYLLFLQKYDKDFTLKMNSYAQDVFCYLSSVLLEGKRPHELLILKKLLDKGSVSELDIKSFLSKEYDLYQQQDAIQSSLNVLKGNFLLSKDMERLHNLCLIKTAKGLITPHDNFKKLYMVDNYKYWINDIIEYGLMNYEQKYRPSIDDVSERYCFALYERYSRKDVCRLMNWEKNEVPQNVGGYKYNKENNNMCIYITYDKSDDVNAIEYEDRFINKSNIICISKKKRNYNSEDMKIIRDSKAMDINILLFMKKSSSEDEYFYLGEVAYEDMKQDTFNDKNGKCTVMEITYSLKHPVRNDIYEYMTRKLD